MCKKLILLTSFVLVLALAGSASADLVAHWKFDEGSGDTAFDSSGNDYHATLINDPLWVPGKIGSFALNLEAGGYGAIQEMHYEGTGSPEVSVCAWIRTSSSGGQYIISFDRNEYYRLSVATTDAVGAGLVGWHLQAGGILDYSSERRVDDGQWHHVCGIYDNGTATIYIDGEPEPSTTQGTTWGSGNLRYGFIGKNSEANAFNSPSPSGNPVDGDIDDLRIYHNALTQAEIKQIMKGILPGVASKPSPEHEAADVPREVVLGWKAGEFAPATNGHKVYLSDNFNDVNDGIGGVAQDANSYTPPQRLDFGTTYYWRVDEVNGPPDYTVYQGDVWSFTTEPFAYAVENITATASSSQPDRGPENIINGSGLDANDLHSRAGTDMWMSGVTGPQPSWIEFQFDRVYKLHEMWVWNSNEAVELAVGFGFKDVTIEYSANGTDYTTLGTTHEFAQAPGTDGYAHNTTVDFGGVGAKYVRLTANSNWGGILPQYGLSEVRFLYIPVQAAEPYPADGQIDVSIGTIAEPIDVILGFRAGREAATHNVYVSTDEQAVIDGTAPVTTVTETSYGPLLLDLGQTYYWRVDEVNEAETPTTWQGDIWSFTTQGYFVVDDFESYNDLDPGDPNSDRIYLTWIDGWDQPANGSQVGYTEPPFAEQGTVQGDRQSMPLFYDNTAGAAYSEAELTLSPAQDWTKHGVRALSLWFYGDPNNTAEQMYVKLNGSKVVYDGDARDITKARWTQWNIDLASFGTNLQNVTKLSIGVGDDTPAMPGGSGMVLFDSIWLYPARCVPSLLKLAADFNDDCVVDYLDLEIMAADWFETDYVVSTAAPATAEMMVQYKLDGNASDSSGNNNHGVEMQGPTYIAGKFGQAIHLDGSNDYVAIESFHYDNASGLTAVSVAAWVRTSVSSNQIIATFDRNEYWRLQIAGEAGGPGLVGFEVMTDTGQVDTDEALNWPANTGRVDDGEWHHLAGVFDNGTLTIYIDGDPKEPYSGGATFGSGDAVRYGYLGVGSESTTFNAEPRTPANFFDGDLDEVYIYHRALTPAEVAYLADGTPGDGELYVAVPSVANLYDGESPLSRLVNFKDFVVLADSWLDEQLWPAQ